MTKDQTTMQDPTGQHPKQPFDTPMQPEPGLARDMQPRPDHGEESYTGTGRLKGRKALVTGGDSGIGRAAAIAFAREGADVVITYLPQEESDAAEVMEVLKATGQKAIAIPGDLSDESFCKQLIEQTVQELGGLDILANIAGKQITVNSIADLTTEQLQQTFTVNVFAMYWLCKYALPYMPAGSSIINTSSIQAYQPSPTLLDYAPTKAAIKAFTEAFAKQVADKGIRVNAVAPGPIWTPLQPSHGQPAEKLEQFGANTPLGRPGQPVEVAPAYVFFASQESSYITGELLGVTGGNHLA
ncbi:MAG TPA: SDR family oxidoreductase [Candidatus Saccharimonadales bacterium]|nr:SDR family oxidoreductase [Candidatus Saccharimonadales bacterium]